MAWGHETQIPSAAAGSTPEVPPQIIPSAAAIWRTFCQSLAVGFSPRDMPSDGIKAPCTWQVSRTTSGNRLLKRLTMPLTLKLGECPFGNACCAVEESVTTFTRARVLGGISRHKERYSASGSVTVLSVDPRWRRSASVHSICTVNWLVLET